MSQNLDATKSLSFSSSCSFGIEYKFIQLSIPIPSKSFKTNQYIIIMALFQNYISYTPYVAAAAKSHQSCPTLCDPIDGSPPGSPVPGILQARTLEWVAISFSNAWKWKWSHSVVSGSLGPHGLKPTRLLCPWDFPSKSTGVGCHCLLLLLMFPSSSLFTPSLALIGNIHSCLQVSISVIVTY